jgi:hypothetical protein
MAKISNKIRDIPKLSRNNPTTNIRDSPELSEKDFMLLLEKYNNKPEYYLNPDFILIRNYIIYVYRSYGICKINKHFIDAAVHCCRRNYFHGIPIWNYHLKTAIEHKPDYYYYNFSARCDIDTMDITRE